MASKNRGRRRNNKNFVAIPFAAAVNLTTLADGGAVGATILSSLGEDLYVVSIDAYWSLKDLTAGEVPIGVGFYHNDLALSNVTEYLDLTYTDPDDILDKEKSRRPVRRAGYFAKGGVSDQEINDGKAVRTKMKMMIGNGHSLAFYAQNKSDATLTTGARVKVFGTVYGRWVR